MNQMSSHVLKVGLTGSIASGKSTALKFFSNHGAYTFNADECLHRAYVHDHALKSFIVGIFGEDILSDGKINRSKLAKRVFSSKKNSTTCNNRLNLESATHQYVFTKMVEAYETAKEQHAPLFVAEIPLLFESEQPFSKWFDKTILIKRPLDQAKASFCTSHEEEDFYSRLHYFVPDEQKKQLCTYCIDNSSSLEEFELQLEALNKTLTSKEV